MSGVAFGVSAIAISQEAVYLPYLAESQLLPGKLIRQNDGTLSSRSKTPFELLGEWVLGPVIDSACYWADVSVELFRGFASFPGAGAVNVEGNQTVSGEELKELLLSAVEVTNRAFQDVRGEKEKLVPPTEMFLGYAERERIATRQIGFLADEMCHFYATNLKKGTKYCFQALYAHVMTSEEINHSAIVMAYKNLGNVLRSEGRPDLAIGYCERAFETALSQQEGEESRGLGLTYLSLSDLFLERGYETTARIYAERGATILHGIHKAQKPIDLVTADNTLANAWRVQGELSRAKETYLDSLNRLKSFSGRDAEVELGKTEHYLGLLLWAEEDLAGAKEHLGEAIRIKVGVYQNSDHPELGPSYSSLGGVLYAAGDLEGAEQAYTKAVRIFVLNQLKDTPKGVMSLHNLALVFWKKGDLRVAQGHLYRALHSKIDEQENLLLVATMQKNFGLLLEEQNLFEFAMQHFTKELECYKALYGTEIHENVMGSYIKLARSAYALEKFRRAELLYERGKEVSRQLFGNEGDEFFNEKIEKCRQFF